MPEKQPIVIFQLSTPRTSSNITNRVFSKAADTSATSPAIDMPTGTSYSTYIQQAISELKLPFKSNPPTIYFMEHAGCLTEAQITEIASAANIALVTQRDPSLLLESMIRKLALDDRRTAQSSRISIHLAEICQNSEERIKLMNSLNLDEFITDQAYVLKADHRAAADTILNAFSQSKGFTSWADLQQHMYNTRDYYLSEEVLTITHPDIHNSLEDYQSPREFITQNPFNFIRSCQCNILNYIQKYSNKSILILDATLFRIQEDIPNRVGLLLSLNTSHISCKLHPGNTSTANIAPSAIIFMDRAIMSSQIDKPYEYPISPNQLPKFLIGKNGLFWELLHYYVRSVMSHNYVRPKSEQELKSIFESHVDYQQGQEIRLLERNPIFSYTNACFYSRTISGGWAKVLSDIREKLPDFNQVFDRVDQLFLDNEK